MLLTLLQAAEKSKRGQVGLRSDLKGKRWRGITPIHLCRTNDYPAVLPSESPSRRRFRQPYRHSHTPSVAYYLNPHRLTYRVLIQDVEKIVAIANLGAVNGNDDVANFDVSVLSLSQTSQASISGRATGSNFVNHHALGNGQLYLIPQRCDVSRANAHLGPADLSLANQLRQDAPGNIYRNCKAHTRGCARRRKYLGVNPDHSSVRVEQRAAGVPRIDRSVGLYRPFDWLPGARGQRTLQSADDAGSQRAIQAERIANCQNFLADSELVGIAERNHGQRFFRRRG